MCADSAAVGGFAKLSWFGRLTGRGRVKTPSIFQLEAAECGAASLAMVLGHFGRRVPLEDLRLACGVSRDGSKASSVLKAARSYGLIAKGLKAEPEHLAKLKPPMIAFVDFCHFLVIESITGGRVYLNDPAHGRYAVTREEFDAMFTGVVLVFEPGPDFRRGDQRPSLAGSLLRRLKGFRLAISFVLLVSLVLVIPGLALPVFSRVFVDYVVVRDLDGWLGPLIGGMALTALVRLILNELRNWHLARAETRLAIQGARELFEHILRLPIPFFGARYAGEIGGRLQLSDGLANLLTGQLAQGALSLFTAVFFLAIMLFYSVPLAIGVLVLSIVSVVVLFAITRAAAEGYRRLSIQEGKLAGVALSGIRDIEVYKASGSEELLFTRHAGLQAGILETKQGMALQMALLSVAPPLITTLITALILVGGGLEVMAGRMSIGGLVAFQTLAASFTQPLVTLIGAGAGFQEVRAYTERIDDVMQVAPDISASTSDGDVTGNRLPKGHIELSGVSFGYLPLEAPLIEDLTLSAKPGQRIALVGASGSGKSTVGRLLIGLFAPTKGHIMLDGLPLEMWPGAARWATLAYVDQTNVLFEGTIRENLTMWDETIAEPDVIAAARDAMIHDAISERPGGYGAKVEEGGRNFSGGQRQRLEIARALVTNPRVIVLDEATSALDTLGEAQIMENLKRRGATLIIIAHRLSTIRDCDEIIVFEHGRVIERGRHEALMQSGGAYARLIEA